MLQTVFKIKQVLKSVYIQDVSMSKTDLKTADQEWTKS